MPLAVTILTPDRTVLDEHPCTQVELPGTGGTLGVLEGHAPLVTPLAVGQVRLFPSEGTSHTVTVGGGLAEVGPEAVKITARSAEQVGDIDVERARAAHKRAEQRLHQPGQGIDIERAQAALARAANRLRVAEHHRPENA